MGFTVACIFFTQHVNLAPVHHSTTNKDKMLVEISHSKFLFTQKHVPKNKNNTTTKHHYKQLMLRNTVCTTALPATKSMFGFAKYKKKKTEQDNKISLETAYTHSLYKSIGFPELGLWSCQELLQSWPFDHRLPAHRTV